MTEYPTTDQRPGMAQGAADAESINLLIRNLESAGSIDLLVRHLELAKLAFSGREQTLTQDGAELAFPDEICTLLYGGGHGFCPLLYVHFPAAKTESESA